MKLLSWLVGWLASYFNMKLTQVYMHMTEYCDVNGCIRLQNFLCSYLWDWYQTRSHEISLIWGFSGADINRNKLADGSGIV